MIPGTYVKIESHKFPVLPGEDTEVVNEGMYGKALCNYLQAELPLLGITVNFYCAEDWGWWVDVTENGFNMGLRVYSHNAIGETPEIYVIASSIDKRKKWYWKKLKSIDVTDQVNSIFDKVVNALKADPDIWSVERHDDFPL